MVLFRDGMGLRAGQVVADIGSGTGLSARPFLEAGCTVYGVEPNAAMRATAEEFLSDFSNFTSVDGTSDATTLADSSCDLVIAAQAFHWFDPEPTRAEMARILKPGGWIALIWNERQLDTTPFLREYEKFLMEFANDYEQVRHENVDDTRLQAFFQVPYGSAKFANSQVFDLDGAIGRIVSSSYMPSETAERFPQMKNEFTRLFAKHAENGTIELLYNTTVYYSQF